MAEIISFLPLYSNKGGKKIKHENICDEATRLLTMINNFFGNKDVASYSGPYLSSTTGGRRYLYGLEHHGFSIRHFFVADKTILKFIVDENNDITLRFQTKILNNEFKFEDEEETSLEIDEMDSDLEPCSMPYQQIFYGAPGTGKSYTINQETKGEDVIRTTFHPDSDYSSFVGAYKPTTIEETVMTVIGTKAVPVEDEEGEKRKESKIIYEFVSQSFLQAYVGAWEKYAAAGADAPKKQFLVIEEINRGNCAQIFGDLFQLLDRNDAGFSDYPIKADADMKRQLAKSFEKLSIEQASSINNLYNGRDVVGEVLRGDILLLPNNLFIWATMNTSDQSLFPIDSAFKRRWDWQYMPISDANQNWVIKANGNEYDWWEFICAINSKIEGGEIQQEDKKLGYFFAKAKEEDGKHIITADAFLSKVIFYLYNDVFKDFGFEEDFFKDEHGTAMTFASYFDEFGKADERRVERFITNVIGKVDSEETAEETEDETAD
ncbi:MAG: AAA family ATPase [Bacteroidales bacterium]|nr:AAA family ATPase [Bacteroidales bacterium]